MYINRGLLYYNSTIRYCVYLKHDHSTNWKR